MATVYYMEIGGGHSSGGGGREGKLNCVSTIPLLLPQNYGFLGEPKHLFGFQLQIVLLS